MQHHCTDQFWYKWCPKTERLTRHAYDENGTPCLPLSNPEGLFLSSTPLFLGGAIQSVGDRCFTEDLQWKVDLVTLSACRFKRFDDASLKCLCGCPREDRFVAMVTDRKLPLLYVTKDSLSWLPAETTEVTRAGACDVQFSRVALYMSHTKKIAVWNRFNNTVETFPRCPGIVDFVTCCHTHRIFALTYDAREQKIITFDAEKMKIEKEETVGEGRRNHGKIFARPCFPTLKTTPYVTEDDKERKEWSVFGKTLVLKEKEEKIHLQGEN